MRPIVVGIDGSKQAAAALRWAVREGDRRSLPVVATLAWTYLDQHAPSGAATFDVGYDEHDARRALRTYVEAAVGDDVDLRLETVCDLPAAALAGASLHASMVVVGATGNGGFFDLTLGSTADRVLTRSAAPVAVIRDEDAAGAVVVGVDGSENGQAALRLAREEARAHGVPLVALTAWLPPALAVWAYEPDAPIFSDLAERASATLEEALAEIDTSDLEVERRVVRANPAAALLEAQPASLLVVGSRGRTGLVGAVLGSVSRQVVHHAEVPVIVVPPTA